MRLLVAAVAALAIAGAIVAWSAGGSEGTDADDEPVYGVGAVLAGSVAALADCGDWNEGTEEERWVTIDAPGLHQGWTSAIDAETWPGGFAVERLIARDPTLVG